MKALRRDLTAVVGFRFSTLVRICVVCALPAFVAGCVPETKYREVFNNLAIANKVNRDLDNRLRLAGQELAELRGSQGMEGVASAAWKDKYAAKEAEVRALEEQNRRLEEQIRNVPELPIPTGGGFTQEDVAGTPGLSIEKGALILEGDVLFAPGKSELKADAKRALDRVAELLMTKYPGKRIYISGHTDNTPIQKSDNKDNWDLGAKRAHAVFVYLKGKSIHDEQMVLISYGFAEPAHDTDPNSKAGQARCRRVEIHLGGESQG